MSKIDNIFLRVINDSEFRQEYDVHPENYSNISDGFLSSNPYVCAVAKLLRNVDDQVSEMEREKRMRNTEGKIELPETFKAKLYKVMLKELTSN